MQQYKAFCDGVKMGALLLGAGPLVQMVRKVLCALVVSVVVPNPGSACREPQNNLKSPTLERGDFIHFPVEIIISR